MNTVNIIKDNFRWFYRPILTWLRKKMKDLHDEHEFQRFEMLNPGVKRVYYLGITAHTNLGDMAQHYCIKKWICENYPDYELVMFESDVIVNKKITDRFFNHFRNIFTDNDIIVFQSGYCTQDLGGNHPLMHRLVCKYMPDARILMMPQTVFFEHEENKRLCAENHNKAKNMLFLARDHVSYNISKEMFPNIRVLAFPDIVTTLIGTFNFNYPRNGICICTRNDGEKYYSDIQIKELALKLNSSGVHVDQKDTQANKTVKDIRAHLQKYIETEIESYSRYQVTITDRYHGTIFSLCAGTPVIILKTTDHKVTTGADWFKGVYDGYVFVARDLNDAYSTAQRILNSNFKYNLSPYFKTNYYDKLKSIFEEKII